MKHIIDTMLAPPSIPHASEWNDRARASAKGHQLAQENFALIYFFMVPQSCIAVIAFDYNTARAILLKEKLE